MAYLGVSKYASQICVSQMEKLWTRLCLRFQALIQGDADLERRSLREKGSFFSWFHIKNWEHIKFPSCSTATMVHITLQRAEALNVEDLGHLKTFSRNETFSVALLSSRSKSVDLVQAVVNMF